jgi:spermidine synthase
LPLLFHPQPRNILFISGGAGGLIGEILSHPDLSRIDYLELDPLILEMLRAYPTELTESELSDSRVNTLSVDGRFFVKNTDSTYDIIFLGLRSPSDLQTNRLFSEEFFREAGRRLNPGGILTLTLPGSLTYLSRELKDFNACILNALSSAFVYTRVIPGDFNLFLASDYSAILDADSALINQRIKQRGIYSDLLLPPYVEYRLASRWSSWFADSLKDATKRSNRDFSAFALFKSLALWNAQFSPGWQALLLSLQRVNLGLILELLLVFLLVSLFLLRQKRGVNFSLPYAVVTTGFFGMLVNLIIIFCFQIVHGYLYYQIAMLIAVFMAGAALGSILVSRYLERISRPLKLFAGLEAGIIIWIFITLLILLSYPPSFVFFILCALTGFWVGMEFPLANRIYLKGQGRLGETVGLIYAADLFGGWFAAVLSGIFFLPILGVVNTCLVIFALKAISLVFLLRVSSQQ